MIPQSPKRKEENSSTVNLTISVIFHAIVLLAFFYFAAHAGLLGEKMERVIRIQMVREKSPEPPKPKPQPPKVIQPKKEVAKVEPPKVVTAPRPAAPVAIASRVVAPPPAEMPSFDFGGGKAIDTSSDPVQIYESFVEYVFHSKWIQPENVAEDGACQTEVDVSVGRDGQISHPVWVQNSGDKRWNDSIQQVMSVVTRLDHLPPTNFPPRLAIIFNVRVRAESSDSALR